MPRVPQRPIEVRSTGPDQTETVGPSKWAFDGLGPDSVRLTEKFDPGPNEKTKLVFRVDDRAGAELLPRGERSSLPPSSSTATTRLSLPSPPSLLVLHLFLARGISLAGGIA